jgi:hypothetical protein
MDPKIHDLVDPGFHFCCTQLLRGGAVKAARSGVRPHLGPPSLKRLNPVVEKHPQEVHPGQPPLPQLLKVLMQGLQLAEDLPSHSLSLGR